MRTRAVKCYKGVLQSSLCCTLARKTNQRLVLCIPALLYCPVVELISDGGQS